MSRSTAAIKLSKIRSLNNITKKQACDGACQIYIKKIIKYEKKVKIKECSEIFLFFNFEAVTKISKLFFKVLRKKK